MLIERVTARYRKARGASLWPVAGRYRKAPVAMTMRGCIDRRRRLRHNAECRETKRSSDAGSALCSAIPRRQRRCRRCGRLHRARTAACAADRRAAPHAASATGRSRPRCSPRCMRRGCFACCCRAVATGWEVEPATFMQAIEELAKADGSTAWCVAQASGCSMAAAYVDPEVAREIFGDAARRDGLGAGRTATPRPSRSRAAIARPASWSFASGIKHAGWLGCHCPVVEPDGTPRLGADGKPVERTMLIPKASAADDRHLARGRPQGHRQRQLHDRRPVRPERIHLHARVRARTSREPGRSTASPPSISTASASPRSRSASRARRSTRSSSSPATKSRRPRPICCATTR